MIRVLPTAAGLSWPAGCVSCSLVWRRRWLQPGIAALESGWLAKRLLQLTQALQQRGLIAGARRQVGSQGLPQLQQAVAVLHSCQQ